MARMDDVDDATLLYKSCELVWTARCRNPFCSGTRLNNVVGIEGQGREYTRYLETQFKSTTTTTTSCLCTKIPMCTTSPSAAAAHLLHKESGTHKVGMDAAAIAASNLIGQQCSPHFGCKLLRNRLTRRKMSCSSRMQLAATNTMVCGGRFHQTYSTKYICTEYCVCSDDLPIQCTQ